MRRLESAEALAEKEGMLHVHPVNESPLYLDVATMHLEVMEDQPDVDVNPIGGGSRVSGAVMVYKSSDPRIKVIRGPSRERSEHLALIKTGTLVFNRESGLHS